MQPHNISENSPTYGLVGFVIAILSPLVSELGIVIQVLAGLCGLILMIHAIFYKRLQIKKLKKEMEDGNKHSG